MEEKSGEVTEKIVKERLALLQADPEFNQLKKLLPLKLKGKEMGKDIEGITDDPEIYERSKDDKRVILLSKAEWAKYKEFDNLCMKLASKHRLHWAAVENLGMGVKKPTISPRVADSIKARLDPIVYLPRDFNLKKRYTSYASLVPPIEAMGIMERLHGLDTKTKTEVQAYVKSIANDIPGCKILELKEAKESKQDSNDEVKIDVCMRIPIGFTAKDVAQIYRERDRTRREILAALGIPISKRRRTSTNLSDADHLKLFDYGASVYDSIDEIYRDDYMSVDMSKDETRRKTVKMRRYRGRQQIKKMDRQ